MKNKLLGNIGLNSKEKNEGKFLKEVSLDIIDDKFTKKDLSNFKYKDIIEEIEESLKGASYFSGYKGNKLIKYIGLEGDFINILKGKKLSGIKILSENIKEKNIKELLKRISKGE